MPAENKINEKKQRLLNLLREMFQLDQPDLDFGLYRIMHAKRGQVEAFLETEFDQLIDKVFASRGARQIDTAKQEYEAARQQAVEFGAPDPDAAPKVQQARARYEVVRLTGGEDAEIYDHLHRFFSRYYDEGDFMSLRRYGKGAAGGAETYAVPYDGSEVVLHWANKDQYYIKTTENFSHFSFDPRKALQKDERGINRQLFDEEGSSGTALKVHFRVIDAAEGAHNNVKTSDKDERYFILDDEAPIAWEGSELVIRINYRPDTGKTGQKSKWQEKRNTETVSKVLDHLARYSREGGNPEIAEEYRTVLARDVPKGKDKKQALLARYLGQYTASNTMDYFIHKDLGGFLRRELDFYLKNEVLKLDDFVGGEDADVQAGGISDARLKAMQSALEKTQAIRLLSQRLIDFLAQLEDFQKKLWLKKKFVVETHYCITLDRIPEKFYPEIAANERQREEWVKLFAIDEITGDMATPGYSVPLTMEFLKANPYLQLDTSFFDNDTKSQLLATQDELEASCNGLLVHSDNFQALSFAKSKFNKRIKAIYIDPPYNTGDDGFPYKDAYRHSSWMTMIANRIEQSKCLLKDDALFFSSIDRDENRNYLPLLFSIFGEDNFIEEIVWQKAYGGGAKTKHINNLHEYVHAFSIERGAVPFLSLPPDANAVKYYKFKDSKFQIRGAFRTQPLNTNSNDFRKNLTYPLPIPPVSSFSSEKWLREAQRIAQLLKDERLLLSGSFEAGWDFQYEDGTLWEGDTLPPPRQWQWSWDKTREALISDEIIIERRNDEWSVSYKQYRFDEQGEERGRKPSSINIGPYTQSGTDELRSMFGTDVSKFPKPSALIKEFVGLGYKETEAWFLDYFAGTGTTGQAVIELNREDQGSRGYFLVEMGVHFDRVLKTRIQKVAYSNDWRDGKPVSRNGISHCFKYLLLESYEDCLNNLALNPIGEAVAKTGDAALQRDYLLRYMLDVETQGSQSLLNVAEFRDPTAYQLEIKKPGSDERVKRNVDLVETFNWLIGLHVDKLHAGRRFSATFVRKPDPLLPKDAHTRLQVDSLTELPPSPPTPLPLAGEGGNTWWFRPVEGYVRTVPGDDRHRQSVLVLWRTLSDDPEQDAAVLEAFLARQMKWHPTRREDKTLYDVIYINGTHNLPNLGKYGEVRLLEEEFHRRMWAQEEV